MAFSGMVLVADVDDFIQPSQACIKPMISDTTPDNKTNKKRRGIVESDFLGGAESESAVADPPAKAKVTLTDCLACSGCITTAESVLISEQSSDEFLREIRKKDKTVVVSISPQSRASIAAHYNLSLQKTQQLLSSCFSTIGASLVVDTSVMTDMSVMECRLEFLSRWHSNRSSLPILTSSCPGWVCYAEKSVGGFVLDYISTVKSPQQIGGTVVKDMWAAEKGIQRSGVYHATVMPCFDKKLEASREDFMSEVDQSRDVDLVLASNEIDDLLAKVGKKLVDFDHVPDAELWVNEDDGGLYGVEGGSGGYLELVLEFAAQELFGGVGSAVTKQGRNKDIKEVQWVVDGKPVLRFAMAYGFRNLQSLMRKIKNKTCPYHYVELMACPSGCLNGGGQIRTGEIKADKQRLEKVGQVFAERRACDPKDNAKAKEVYEKWLGGVPDKPTPQFQTQYHEREKLANPLTIKW